VKNDLHTATHHKLSAGALAPRRHYHFVYSSYQLLMGQLMAVPAGAADAQTGGHLGHSQGTISYEDVFV
jgi:hypothetical protein